MAYIGGKQTKSIFFDKNEKFDSWKYFFHPPSAIKAQKLTAVCFFKIESVLSKNKKKQISVQISQIFTEIFFFLFLLSTDSILNKHTTVNFWAFIALGGWKTIFRNQTFHFCQKFLTLSVSHQYKPFKLKNSPKLLFFGQSSGKQTKSKKIWKIDKRDVET